MNAPPAVPVRIRPFGAAACGRSLLVGALVLPVVVLEKVLRKRRRRRNGPVEPTKRTGGA